MQVDWQEVVDRKPKGYLELNNGERVIHGPIEDIAIDESDFVVITLKWAARMELNGGIPSGRWVVAEEKDKEAIIPNLVVPFVIEDTPNKGPRVRFAGTNILYFNEVEGLNPARVEGLVISNNKRS